MPHVTPFIFPLSLPPSQPLLTVTYPQDGLWIIELHNGEDSRLTESLIDDAFKPALDIVEKHWNENRRNTPGNNQQGKTKRNGGEGALIIVGKRDQDKFFSNGFVYDSIKNNPGFFTDTANPLYARLLTYPIPTIAAVNGHCFAGGFMLALCCDYRVMTDGSRRRTWMCMNEVRFTSVHRGHCSLAAILDAKVSDPNVKRRIALEGHRFTPSEAHAAGIIDRLASCGGTGADLGTEGVLIEALKLAKEISGLPKEGVWGLIKTVLYRDCLQAVRLDAREHTSPLIPITAKL
ncbi:ClpP/crotonase-like domain-containing protein [Melanogaster broomeanus]|nr:ClpP/crotonase-like domain-containing protein [Melanogaster broomeanus]